MIATEKCQSMRVLLLDGEDCLTGRLLHEGLEARGHQCQIFGREELPEQLELIRTQIDLVLGYGPHTRSMFPLKSLLALPHAERPQVVWWLSENLPVMSRGVLFVNCLASLRLQLDRLIPQHRRETPRVNWKTSWLCKGQKYRIIGEFRELLRMNVIDLIVCNGESRQKQLEHLGIPSRTLYMGYTPTYGQDLSLPRDIDVLFLGKIDSAKRKRTLYELNKQLFQRGIDIEVVDGVHRFVSGDELTELLNRTKILVNLNRSKEFLILHRQFLAAANGTLLITHPLVDYGPFIPGKHLVVVELADMAQTIEQYLRDDTLRRTIADAAHSLAIENITLDKSLAALERWLGRI